MTSLFSKSSRYFKQSSDSILTKNGSSVSALKLRFLPETVGIETIVTETDRLDIISQQKYGDPTLFWHIADANTELDANSLIKQQKKDQKINIPE
jgi:hypothetical protein